MTLYRKPSYQSDQLNNYPIFNSYQLASVFSENKFNPLEMLEIFDVDRQIKVIAREENPNISKYLKAIAPKLNGGFRYILKADEILSRKIVLNQLMPEENGRDDFLADLDYLTSLYIDLMECPQIGIRLEVLNKAMCPKFHVDRTGIRLLCTYLGQGTQWLEDSCADRSKLGMSSALIEDSDSGLILNSDGIHEADSFAIALLKGSLWQGNESLGVIHRSPATLNNLTRILFSIDAIW